MLPTTAAQPVPFKSHHKSFAYRIGNDRNYFFVSLHIKERNPISFVHGNRDEIFMQLFFTKL
jgi:hypothetical protein